MSDVKPIPEGYHAVTPFLNVRDAAGLIVFLEEAFGARVLERHDRPDGLVMHAEVRIADSTVMLSEACDAMGPMPGCLYLYVDDADAVYQQALRAGGQTIMEPADAFWGDRMGGIKDPAGNLWWIATHIEDVSTEERARRAQAFAEQQAG